MILVFCSQLERANFVNAIKFEKDFDVEIINDVIETLIFESIYITTVISNISRDTLEILDEHYKDKSKSILLIHPLIVLDDMKEHWYVCQSADEIEAFMEVPLTRHAKNRITYLIFNTTITLDNVMESFLERLPKSRIEVVEEEEKEEVREVKRIKASECSYCLEDLPRVMFDCGHEVFCYGCSQIWNKTCPICRKETKTIFVDNEEKK
jgi:hypothetical protein